MSGAEFSATALAPGSPDGGGDDRTWNNPIVPASLNRAAAPLAALPTRPSPREGRSAGCRGRRPRPRSSGRLSPAADPRARPRSRSTSARPGASRSVSGSSRTRSGGPAISTDAIASNCFCPPERRAGCASACPARPTSASIASTARSISAGSRSRFSSTTPISSRTSGVEKQSSGFCVTSPAGSTGGASAASGARWTSPAVGARTPASTSASVLLPAPFAPRTTRVSPGRTSRETSRSAGRARLPAAGSRRKSLREAKRAGMPVMVDLSQAARELRRGGAKGRSSDADGPKGVRRRSAATGPRRLARDPAARQQYSTVRRPS